MDSTPVALIVGLVSAATTSLGWIVVHYFTRRREVEARESIAQKEEKGREISRYQTDRTRRLEVNLKFYERQIQEFYAPLHSNIQFIFTVWLIGERFKRELSEKDNPDYIDDVRKKIDRALGVKYFTPIHADIRDILKEKMFLIDGIIIPDSITKYLMHSVMEDVQRGLSDEDNINTISVKGVEFPDQFPVDVKIGLDKAMKAYDDIIRELAKPASTTKIS